MDRNGILLLIILIFSIIGICRSNSFGSSGILDTFATMNPSNTNKCIPATKASGANNSCNIPLRATAGPLVFGPYLWTALHLIGAGYNQDKNGNVPKIYQINAKKFIQALPFMVPCGDCGFHLHEFLQTQDLDTALKTKDGFIGFLVDAHNNVTKNVNKIVVDPSSGPQPPPKKLWTLQEAKDTYSCVDTCIKDPRVWSNTSDGPAHGGGLWKQIQADPGYFSNDMRQC